MDFSEANLSDLRASASVVVAASAEDLYDFIADMPRIGEISAQCIGGVWETENRAVGALFVGSNVAGKRSWKARARVIVAHRPSEFAWENIGDGDKGPPDPIEPLARWGYTFTTTTAGTQVEESWRLLTIYGALAAAGEQAIRAIPALMQGSIEQTLSRLKARFETTDQTRS